MGFPRVRTSRIWISRLFATTSTGSLVTGLLLLGSPAVATTSAVTPQALNFAKISFQPRTVDARLGNATASLAWTVLDSNLAATTVQGAVHIQQFSAAGARVGPEKVVR